MLLRLLAALGLLWTGKQIVNQVSTLFQPHRNVKNSDTEQELDNDMVKDPVCQTYIPKSIAVQKTFHGDTLYFCSEECQLKFTEQQHAES